MTFSLSRDSQMEMASESYEAHFVFVPLMCPGHIIPLMDMARLLGERNVAVTMVLTQLYASRFSSIIDRITESGLSFKVLQLRFPSTEVGLPVGCESIDSLPSFDMVGKFLTAQGMLQEPFEEALRDMNPFPSCIVTDRNVPWISATASKFQIPRIWFDGTSCFTNLCSHNLQKSKVYKDLSSSEPFVVPGLPDRIEFTKSQLPGSFNPGSNKDLIAFRDKVKASEKGAFGVIFNSFEELENEYVKAYQQAKGSFKVWCIGPVSLCNKQSLDKAERGRLPSIDENQCMKWLDSQPPSSVIYTCFGSLNRIPSRQLIEIAMALETSNRPFIWVLREGYKREEMEKWLEEGYEERVKGRGLLIRGWAPQLLILSHQATGGFITHCGWNSTLEGISAGVPMITWPLFAEQFYNEKLIVQVLDVGVGVGTQQVAMLFGDKDESEALVVKAEEIKKAIDKLMNGGDETQRRRKRSRELSAKAEKAVQKGGSSYDNITRLIEDVIQEVQMIKKSSEIGCMASVDQSSN